MRHDTITGNVTADKKPSKIQVVPDSRAMQTYYDMLVNQKKPFNLRKGNLVTADRIQRLDLHQKFRCLVPSDYQINPLKSKEIESMSQACKKINKSAIGTSNSR